jgi:hypothetical protein
VPFPSGIIHQALLALGNCLNQRRIFSFQKQVCANFMFTQLSVHAIYKDSRFVGPNGTLRLQNWLFSHEGSAISKKTKLQINSFVTLQG